VQLNGDVSSLADAGSIIRAHKSRNRSGPSLTTLAHAYPLADFNLHNRHSRKNQLLRKNLGSTLTATGALPPARMARSARPIVEGQNVSVEQHWLEGHYERTPALVAEAARQRCGSGTVPACFRWTIGGLFGRPKREKPCGFCRVLGPLTAGIEARLFIQSQDGGGIYREVKIISNYSPLCGGMTRV
jgi:hypothetical protein